MSPMNLGVDHIHFVVRSLDEAIRFCKSIGLEFTEYTEHGGKSCMMRAPGDNVLIELQEARNIDNPGLNHIAFLVDDLDTLCDELVEQGMEVDGPLDNPKTGRRLATVRDPHGFLWQLVQK